MPIAKANDIDIWYETFGKQENPALLLIMGGCGQGILWPDEFCERLAKAEFFVIRYDHRDTGLSSCFNYQQSPYDLLDMMKDAIGLLDYLNVNQSHVVGLSMGGPIAELLAVHYPERILSITLMSTSCDFRPLNLAFAGLPHEEKLMSPPKDIYLKWMKKFMTLKPNDDKQHLELRLEGWRILNGDKTPFEEDSYRVIHKHFLQRMLFPESVINHMYVCRASEEIVKSIPAKVNVPVCIIHGSEDAILPPEHGLALAALIQQAKFILVEGMGHIPNKCFYDLIIKNICII